MRINYINAEIQSIMLSESAKKKRNVRRGR